MKKHLSGFFAGALCTAIIFGCGVTAMAATGRMSIEVDPINIQVNGEVFKPKDATGAEVPVFAYHGTTYAPLRALAEAYGLEVGYDAAKNMATVRDPDFEQEIEPTIPSDNYAEWTAEEEAAYQEFKGMWEIVSENGEPVYKDHIALNYKSKDISILKSYALSNEKEIVTEFCKRFETELLQMHGISSFVYGYEDNGIVRLLWGDSFNNDEWSLGYSNRGYKKIIAIPDIIPTLE